MFQSVFIVNSIMCVYSDIGLLMNYHDIILTYSMHGAVLLANKCEQFEVLHQYHGSSIPSLWHEYIHINIFKTITKFCSSQAWYAMHSTVTCKMVNSSTLLVFELLFHPHFACQGWPLRIKMKTRDKLTMKNMISCQLWTCIDGFTNTIFEVYHSHVYCIIWGTKDIKFGTHHYDWHINNI